MMRRPLPDQTLLRRLLDYDPETGKLRWRARTTEAPEWESACRKWNKRYAGKLAFVRIDRHGYLRGAFLGQKYIAHRIIWKWMTGLDPDEVDHINGDGADNRWANLRDVTAAVNRTNMRRSARNVSGVTGVWFEAAKGKWVASIQIGGRKTVLGSFVEFDAAVAVRREAERQLGFGPNHGADARRAAR